MNQRHGFSPCKILWVFFLTRTAEVTHLLHPASRVGSDASSGLAGGDVVNLMAAARLAQGVALPWLM